MISKQEGRDGARLAPGGTGGLGSEEISSPSPPSPALYGCSVPAERRFSRGPQLRSSRGTGVEPGGGVASAI